MKIAVCMKRVPATDTKVKPGAGRPWIDSTGVEYVLNPYDEFAIEEALRLKEARGGAGEVVVVCVGSADAQKELRTALAMGADRAILLEDAQAELRDAQEIAGALAAAVQELGSELVLLGKTGVDRDQSQTGQRVATRLGWGCAIECAKIAIDGSAIRAEREIEGGREVLELSLPAVLSCEKGLNEPRYAGLKGIMAAKKKPLETKAPQYAAAQVEVLSFEMPPERSGGRIVGSGVDAVAELVRLLQQEAKVL
ncbi:MAG: electron transfer flavoprotein subunit beta/FixA family protein [Planctomycetes bacterium]|nr:electron transfer flavoprotein subunit beta/FixA family protein [Planctomycetota bacterium]